MPFFPSLQRPTESPEGVPGAVGAGAVSVVQLFDLADEVMRSVVIFAGVDGAVYVVGGKLGGRSLVGSAPIAGRLLIDVDAVCGAPTAALAPSGGVTSSPSSASSAVGRSVRQWRVQSLVAYRTSYNECAVIVARIPTAPPSQAADLQEYTSELLFFRTDPLDCLASDGGCDSARVSTRRSVLSLKVQRPGEHIMRLFALHVEPSATGRRINSSATDGGKGSIRYAHQSPPGLSVLCSSVVYGGGGGGNSGGGGGGRQQRTELYGLFLPPSAAERVKHPEDVLRTLDGGDEGEGRGGEPSSSPFLPLWSVLAKTVRAMQHSVVCSLAITCTATPEPRAGFALDTVGWMIAAGCTDGTVLLVRERFPQHNGNAASLCAASASAWECIVIGRLIGPVGWVQFFSNKSIQRLSSGQTDEAQTEKCAAIDERLGRCAPPVPSSPPPLPAAVSCEARPEAGADAACGGAGAVPPPPRLASSSFSSGINLLGLDMAGRALRWGGLTSSATPSLSSIFDAEEVTEDEVPPSMMVGIEPLASPIGVAVAGDAGGAAAAVVPTETLDRKRKDKSLVERWLNRGKLGGQQPQQQPGGLPSTAHGSSADLCGMSHAAADESQSRLCCEEGASTAQGSASRLMGSRRRLLTSSARDLSHVHSNSSRLTVVDGSNGSWVGSVIGRGPLAAAFVDHCFDEEARLHGPQLLISTLGRRVAFCARYQPAGKSTAERSTTAKPQQQHSASSHLPTASDNSQMAVIDYFDVFSPMSFLGLVDFSGVGDSFLFMAGNEQVCVMPLHDRPPETTLLSRLKVVRTLLGMHK